MFGTLRLHLLIIKKFRIYLVIIPLSLPVPLSLRCLFNDYCQILLHRLDIPKGSTHLYEPTKTSALLFFLQELSMTIPFVVERFSLCVWQNAPYNGRSLLDIRVLINQVSCVSKASEYANVHMIVNSDVVDIFKTIFDHIHLN